MNEKQAKRIRRARRDAVAHLIEERGSGANEHQIAEVVSDAAYVVGLGMKNADHRRRGRVADVLRAVAFRGSYFSLRARRKDEVGYKRRGFTVTIFRAAPMRLFDAARLARPLAGAL